MPKVSKKSTNKTSKEKLSSNRHLPLGQVLLEGEYYNKYAVSKQKPNLTSAQRLKAEEEEEEEWLDDKTSKRILQLGALQQREELELEQQEQQQQHRRSKANKNNIQKRSSHQAYSSCSDSSSSEDEDQSMQEEEEEDDDNENTHLFRDTQVVRHSGGYVTVDGPGLSDAEEEEEEQRAAMNRMVPTATTTQQRRNLADLILSKIRDKEADASHTDSAAADLVQGQLPPKVVEVSLFKPYIQLHIQIN
jgi:hypothetical protein